MSTTLSASLEERLDDQTLRHVREDVAVHEAPPPPTSTADAPQGWFARVLESQIAPRIGQRHLAKLALHSGQVTKAWRELPQRMHLVANQTQLMMELVDDFRAGKYRKLPWRSLSVAAAAILYAASPVDVVPDMLIGLGLLDDMLLVAIAARFLRDDLEAYCEFKGYRFEDYFAAA